MDTTPPNQPPAGPTPPEPTPEPTPSNPPFDVAAQSVDPAEPVQPSVASPFFSAANTAPQPTAGAPTAPSAPIDPTVAPGAAPQPPVTPPAKRSKKPLLFAGIGAVVLLAIAAAIFFFVYFSISKEDYKQAAAATADITTLEKKSRESLQLITGTAEKQPTFTTTEAVSKAMSDVTTSLTAYQTAIDTFDKQKALHDGDVSKLYKTFKTNYNAYVDFSTSYTSSASKALGASTKCTEAYKDAPATPTYDTYQKQTATCRAALVAAQEVSDPDWKAFIKAYITYLDAAGPVYKEFYAGTTSNDYTAAFAALKKLTPATEAYTTASKSVTDHIAKRYKETDNITTSFKAVSDALDKKAQ